MRTDSRPFVPGPACLAPEASRPERRAPRARSGKAAISRLYLPCAEISRAARVRCATRKPDAGPGSIFASFAAPIQYARYVPLPHLHGIEAMESWPVPEGLEGHTRLLRVQVSRPAPARRVRPALRCPGASSCVAAGDACRADSRDWRRCRSQPVGAVLDMLEFDGLTPGQALARLRAGLNRPHEGPSAVDRARCRGSTCLQAPPSMRRGEQRSGPASRPWVMQATVPGADVRRHLRAMRLGAGYQSDDGGTRELRVPRAKSVD